MGFWNLIRGMNTRRMWQTAREVSEQARRPAPLVFCDMAWCGLKYKAGYLDYALFQFWQMNGAQRETVLTRGKNNRYVAALNDRSGWKYFEEKTAFLAKFAPYIGRKWIDLNHADAQQLQAFGQQAGAFIVKPADGTHGDGVERIDADAVQDWPALFSTLKGQGRNLCEEIIRQHPALDRIWPGSVNTIRVVTILKEGTAHVVAAYLRVGNGVRPVDNFNGGGMVTPVDTETGVIRCAARDKRGTLYPQHPATHVTFQGAAIPLWPQVLELVQQAAQVVPEVRYVGWDVAITPAGPLLVEGNHYPGHDIYCLPGQNPEKQGILPAWEAVVPYNSL